MNLSKLHRWIDLQQYYDSSSLLMQVAFQNRVEPNGFNVPYKWGEWGSWSKTIARASTSVYCTTHVLLSQSIWTAVHRAPSDPITLLQVTMMMLLVILMVKLVLVIATSDHPSTGVNIRKKIPFQTIIECIGAVHAMAPWGTSQYSKVLIFVCKQIWSREIVR